MILEMRRVIVFAKDMAAMASGFIEFDAGTVRLALHRGGTGEAARRAPKIVFYTADVASARADLAGRGVKLGKVKLANDLHLCEGKDPEGNPFQISNRP